MFSRCVWSLHFTQLQTLQCKKNTMQKCNDVFCVFSIKISMHIICFSVEIRECKFYNEYEKKWLCMSILVSLLMHSSVSNWQEKKPRINERKESKESIVVSNCCASITRHKTWLDENVYYIVHVAIKWYMTHFSVWSEFSIFSFCHWFRSV